MFKNSHHVPYLSITILKYTQFDFFWKFTNIAYTIIIPSAFRRFIVGPPRIILTLKDHCSRGGANISNTSPRIAGRRLYGVRLAKLYSRINPPAWWAILIVITRYLAPQKSSPASVVRIKAQFRNIHFTSNNIPSPTPPHPTQHLHAFILHSLLFSHFSHYINFI